MKGLEPEEVEGELDDVYRSFTPADACVYNWVNEFNFARTSTQ